MLSRNTIVVSAHMTAKGLQYKVVSLNLLIYLSLAVLKVEFSVLMNRQ